MYTEITKLLIDFLQKHPYMAAIYIATIFVIPIKTVVIPHYYGKIVDAINGKKNLWYPFAIVMIIIIVMQIGHVINDINETKMYPEMQRFFRQKMMHVIMEKNSSSFAEQETGKIITQLLRIPTGMYNFMDVWKVYLFPRIVSAIIAVVYFSYHDIVLGMGLLVIIVLTYFVILFAPKWCQTIAVDRDEAFNSIHEEVDDVLRNMIAIYSSDRLDKENEHLDELQDKYKQLNGDTVTCGLKHKLYLVPLMTAYIIFFMYYCYKRVKSASLKIGMFVSLFFILMSIYEHFFGLLDLLTDMVGRMGILQDYITNYGQNSSRSPHNRRTCTKAPTKVDPNSHLRFDNVTFTYPKGSQPVITNLTLDIKRGERVLIMGRIGSGKSSILRLVMRYHMPQEGEIYLDGEPYCMVPTNTIRKKVGYVPQNPILFNRTIYENIVYGHEHTSKEKVQAMLHDLGLAHIFTNLKNGLDTRAGKLGSILSGGQRQIVWILRVMLQDPDILLLDEPTASIDDSTKGMVDDLLRLLMTTRSRTVVMVSHDDFLVSFASRKIEFTNGKLLSDINVEGKTAQSMNGNTPPPHLPPPQLPPRKSGLEHFAWYG